MANQFFVAPSPHVHSAESTTKIMRDVVIALLPALVVSALLFGWSVLGVTALADTLPDALKAAYAAAEKISFKDMHMRHDIGANALRKD